MGIVSSAKRKGVYRKGVVSEFQSPMGIVSSAKNLRLLQLETSKEVSIPDGDSFLREAGFR